VPAVRDDSLLRLRGNLALFRTNVVRRTSNFGELSAIQHCGQSGFPLCLFQSRFDKKQLRQRPVRFEPLVSAAIAACRLISAPAASFCEAQSSARLYHALAGYSVVPMARRAALPASTVARTAVAGLLVRCARSNSAREYQRSAAVPEAANVHIEIVGGSQRGVTGIDIELSQRRALSETVKRTPKQISASANASARSWKHPPLRHDRLAPKPDRDGDDYIERQRRGYRERHKLLADNGRRQSGRHPGGQCASLRRNRHAAANPAAQMPQSAARPGRPCATSESRNILCGDSWAKSG